MNMHQLFSDTRKALTAIPIILALLMGTNLSMAAPAAVTTAAKKPAAEAPASVVTTVVSGTVEGLPENVLFNKVTVEITSRLIVDDFDGSKRVSLDIRFIKAYGVGAATKLKYASSYTDPNLLKSLPATGTVLALEQTFVFGQDKKPAIEDLSGLLKLNLTVDGNGVILYADGSIGTVPVFVDPTL